MLKFVRGGVEEADELNMKTRRDSKMTPPQHPLCFVLVISIMCVLPGIAQNENVEYSSVFTDTALESGKYRFMCVHDSFKCN